MAFIGLTNKSLNILAFNVFELERNKIMSKSSYFYINIYSPKMIK